MKQGATISLVLLAAVAVAGEPDQTTPGALRRLSLEELSQIEVVSPSKEPQPAFRTAMAVHVITADDIRRSGATSIPEVLRLAPGVEVARLEGSKWSIGIRGFGSRLSRSVLVLIDGRTVYTTFFAGTYWEVQDTMLQDIDRIEVIRGPGGTIWGPNAVNGVINIITKHTSDTQGSLVSVVAGNEDQGLLQYRYGGGKPGKLTYRVYAKSFTRGPEFHQDRRNYDDWRGAQTGFRLDWNRNNDERVMVTGDLYGQDAGQRVPVINYLPPFRQIIERNANLSGGNLNFRWNKTLSSRSDIQIQAYYDRTNRHEANFGEARDTGDIDLLVRNRLNETNQLTWGLGARASNGTAEEVSTGLTFDPLSRTDYLLTAFLQDEIALVPDRLSLILGSKFLRTNFASFQAEPSARLLWMPTARQAVWTAFTHSVRTPSRAERDFNLSGYLGNAPDGTPFFARFNRNPDFSTEQLNGYEAGYRQLLGSTVLVDFAAFYNRYHDLFSQELAGPIAPEQSPGQPHLLLPAQFRNGLAGAGSGFEIAPEWRPRSWWSLKGSYSYLALDLHKSATSRDIGTAPIIEGTSPRHQGVVQSEFQFSRNFEIDLIYRGVSALPGQGIPGYSTGDARFAWRVRRDLELSLVGRNLLQPWHLEFANDPGPPVGIRRSAYLRLIWTK